MADRRAKVLFVVAAVLGGALCWLVASAYLIERDLPGWLAGGVGALAFPVLPGVWHVVGERRRRARIAAAKSPPKQSLSASDRFVLRMVAVALAAIGPMVAIGGLAVARAAWDHRTWFIPEPAFDPIAAQAVILARVPADAELLVVVRDDDEGSKKPKPGLGVVAYGARQLAILLPDNPDKPTPTQVNDQRGKIPFLPYDPVQALDLDDELAAVVSARWLPAVATGGVGPSATLRAELDRAPADAKIKLAFVPLVSLGRDDVKRGAAWMRQKAVNEKLEVTARVEATSERSAQMLAGVVREIWRARRDDVPEKCRAEVDKIVDAVRIERTGVVLDLHLEVEPAQLMALMMCAPPTVD